MAIRLDSAVPICSGDFAVDDVESPRNSLSFGGKTCKQTKDWLPGARSRRQKACRPTVQKLCLSRPILWMQRPRDVLLLGVRALCHPIRLPRSVVPATLRTPALPAKMLSPRAKICSRANMRGAHSLQNAVLFRSWRTLHLCEMSESIILISRITAPFLDSTATRPRTWIKSELRIQQARFPVHSTPSRPRPHC